VLDVQRWIVAVCTVAGCVTMGGVATAMPEHGVHAGSVRQSVGEDDEDEGNGCENLRAGEQCGDGNGRTTAGGSGTGNVSHEGWPAITGVLWKVTSEGRGKHARGGTSRDDELLGHHGDDTINGGLGQDVIWGDWDPDNNNGSQSDVLRGGRGRDWLYTSHGRNAIYGGPGNDHVWAYYGRGTIDCGSGSDALRVRSSVQNFTVRNCEHVSGF
jgi:Ca2+-binding RTX toxin-like protein